MDIVHSKQKEQWSVENMHMVSHKQFVKQLTDPLLGREEDIA